MARRVAPVRKSVKETLSDILAGHREASHAGPAAALKYLERVLAGQVNLPMAVRSVVYDRMADAQVQLQDWEGCAASVAQAIRHLPDMESEFPHAYRQMLTDLTCFERGITAHSELGQFHEALDLCDMAIRFGLGAHYQAKRDSLGWAR